MLKRLAYILRGPASILLLNGILAAAGAAINYLRQK